MHRPQDSLSPDDDLATLRHAMDDLDVAIRGASRRDDRFTLRPLERVKRRLLRLQARALARRRAAS